MNDGGFFNYDNLNNIIRSSNRQYSNNRNDKIKNLLVSDKPRDENKNYANFTREFYKERYNIPSNIPTPSNFKINEVESRGEYSLSLIKKRNERDDINAKISSLNFFSWIRAYNKLTESVKIDVNLLIDNKNINVLETMSNCFIDYTFSNSEIVICEVSEVKFLDCIQVIECKVCIV
jgi:hypothetical protein